MFASPQQDDDMQGSLLMQQCMISAKVTMQALVIWGIWAVQAGNAACHLTYAGAKLAQYHGGHRESVTCPKHAFRTLPASVDPSCARFASKSTQTLSTVRLLVL